MRCNDGSRFSRLSPWPSLRPPPRPQRRLFAITNAHLVTPGPVGEVENGTVIVRDGRIAAAGAAIVVPSGMRIVDARGATVTPGFVAVNTALGLVEVNSVGGSVDNRTHNSGISASFDVQYGLNPDSTLIPIARLGGITHAVVMPDYDDSDQERELPFAGKAALITLGEGAAILHRSGVAMMLELGEDGAARIGGSRAAEFVQLRQIFDLARQPPRDEYPFELSQADVAALKPVLEGTMPLIVVVHRAADIRQVLRLARDYKLKIILSGAEEAWRVADEIAAAKSARAHQPDLEHPVELRHAWRVAPECVDPQGGGGRYRDWRERRRPPRTRDAL